MLSLIALTAAVVAAPPAFDRKAWLDDFKYLERYLEAHYSHLEWFASPEGGVDLPALHRRTLEALGAAKSDAEASFALSAFVEAFHDGHLLKRPYSPPPDAGTPQVAEPEKPTRFPDGKTACAALGYILSSRVQFSLPFESLAGFTLTHDGLSDAFRAGIIERGGVRIGIVRIQKFRSTDFAALCVEGWRDGGVPLDELKRGMDPLFLEVLARRLTEFKAAKVNAVLVDVGGNGGGNDLGDWAVRAFTDRPIQSAPLLVMSGDAGLPYLEEQVRGLSKVLSGDDGGLRATTREVVQRELSSFEARKALASKPPCARDWVWKERKPWRTASCSHLIEAGWFSGPLGYVDAGVYERPAAETLYWATAADAVRGTWQGKSFVLVDSGTASSAEAFTTTMRDRDVARVIGARTFGAGCGFMNDVPPVVLPHSKLSWSVPNCVRLRADGADDVAGVTPDFPLTALPGESPRARAERALRLIAAP